MTTQRQTGLFLSIFSVVVVVSHWIHSGLSFYDVVYGTIAIPLITTVFFESVIGKAFQVFIITFVAVLMVIAGGDSIYLGVVIMAIAYLFSYTYGFLENTPILKTFCILGVFTTTIFISTKFDIFQTLTWMMMCSLILWSFWINAKHLVIKSQIADEIIKRDLEQTLATSEALLEETVRAGMVLVSEIKSKDVEYDSKE